MRLYECLDDIHALADKYNPHSSIPHSPIAPLAYPLLTYLPCWNTAPLTYCPGWPIAH